MELGDGSFRLKKSFEAADKTARRIVILGEDELQSGILTVKDFSTGIQTKVPRAELAAFSNNERVSLRLCFPTQALKIAHGWGTRHFNQSSYVTTDVVPLQGDKGMTFVLDFLGNLERTHMCGELRAANAGEQVV